VIPDEIFDLVITASTGAASAWIRKCAGTLTERTFSCPARCYVGEARRVDFAYEACLECGTCLLVCDRRALDWHYPHGGYGGASASPGDEASAGGGSRGTPAERWSWEARP
jgi:Fe-S-cluster-containing hydrogenase component 2